jgi:hypothetical protein
MSIAPAILTCFGYLVLSSTSKRFNEKSRNEHDAATGLCDLSLGLLADVSRLHNNGDIREAALAEDLGVTEGEEIDDGDGVLRSLFGEVFVLDFLGKQGPKLERMSKSREKRGL